ncbi:DUF1905 domain-containing protein [Egicoccus sp. AB-alg2]|uniref:DUF1905 domain-containing protein n=1 Tax=Egicoccus sp. AB-alg2 TaxID=3242693 RepID=UPI00359D8E05
MADTSAALLTFEFDGELWYWRGPAPFYFVTVPADACALIHDEAPLVSYGWGMIPATIRIGESEWETALWPKDGRYVVPVKAAVRDAEHLDEGDHATVHLRIDGPG